ncbi:hypothetical protein Q5H91_04480 [Sphingomonas sp. KR1UV-12]|uniref:Uncharacterized protein n=1 Tax=Sphingomonas aurea TaxID=3063994 RepID=A0ABT9EHM0_9SPHN|nr:hypothetical protein [Sphingomonas sp. KR1UV-12]MDP1026459.1 hypothetical protein [Sphingomonas sp. KR1UV-12]
MWIRIRRLFVIKSKFEAFLVIYCLAVGATHRGAEYLHLYPGVGGWMLFGCCTIAVFMAGGRIIDAVEHDRERAAVWG